MKIHGDWIDIRAEVADLSMLSAHADSNELIRWLAGFQFAPDKTFIVHGEPSSSAALRDRIEEELNWSCVIPRMRERFELGRGHPARESGGSQLGERVPESTAIGARPDDEPT